MKDSAKPNSAHPRFHDKRQGKRIQTSSRISVRRPHVIKFGGTSLADASCIERVIEIIGRERRCSDVVVVVSAMSGVTDMLVKAAQLAEAQEPVRSGKILEEVRARHESAMKGVIPPGTRRSRIRREIRDLCRQGEEYCARANATRNFTAARRDAILSIGERLSARLLAAALEARQIASEPVDATEIVITDGNHGSAAPHLGATRARCEGRLRPLLRRKIIPIVTGFIGATPEGAITTLGRNSSDLSATLVGGALDANEVTIWTDVSGVMTADPKVVANARVVPEISYDEAAALARFGAKVLHPKTLSPLQSGGVSLRIRSTFETDRPGTKITPTVRAEGRVKAVAAMNEIVTVIGTLNNRGEIISRVLKALGNAGVKAIASVEKLSEHAVSFVVAPEDVSVAQNAIHEELQLNAAVPSCPRDCVRENGAPSSRLIRSDYQAGYQENAQVGAERGLMRRRIVAHCAQPRC